MYFIDFFRNVFKKKNIGIIIWLILNTVMMCFILGSCIKDELPYDLEPAVRYIIAFGSGIVIYFITILIALSPVGEFFLRLQNGCKKIVREDHNDRLMPLFQEVYQKAKNESPEMSDNIQMFMSNDDEPNAFAVGRKTICITKGLLEYSDDEIRAVLSHEFGHIAHKDTDAILVVGVGNMIVALLFVLFRVFVNVVARILNFMISFVSDSAGTFVAGTLTRLLIDFLLVLVMKLWTKLGVLLCLHSSRQAEFSADKFAHSLGYGDELCVFLDKTDDKEFNSKGLWAILNSTHPDADVRIAELQKLTKISFVKEITNKKINNSTNFSKSLFNYLILFIFEIITIISIALIMGSYVKNSVDFRFENAWNTKNANQVVDLYYSIIEDNNCNLLIKKANKDPNQIFESCLNKKLLEATKIINQEKFKFGGVRIDNEPYDIYSTIENNYGDLLISYDGKSLDEIIITEDNKTIWDNLQKIIESKNNYYLGEWYYSENNYSKAKDYFENVIEEDMRYNEAQEYIDRCKTLK